MSGRKKLQLKNNSNIQHITANNNISINVPSVQSML